MTRPSSTTSALTALGADRLAQALIELAERNDDADRMITRLTATTDEKVRRFKSQLAGVRRMKFNPRRKASAFAAKLEDILSLLDVDALPPKKGVQLVASFFESDQHVFESVDDSSGYVGDMFALNARNLFIEFAKRLEDHGWLASLLFDLLSEDRYGVRSHLLARASEFLSAEDLRALADRFWEAAGSGGEPSATDAEHNWERRHWLYLVETAAEQLKDPELFERARRVLSPDLDVAACVEIAKAYSSAGRPAIALEWLNRIDTNSSFLSFERERLLMEVMQALGRHDDLEMLARHRFQESPNQYSLNDLLDVVGQDQREDIVSEASARILRSDEFSLTDATFLADCGRSEDAAKYVVHHWRAFNGDFWSALLPLAERMKADGHALAATVLYRALTDSVLDRANSRAYGHAARHLRHLDELAEGVDHWSDVPPHDEYLASIRERHQRKSSFWRRYDGTGA